MNTYLALILFYSPVLDRVDPETGAPREHGYIYPGETIHLNDEQAALHLERGNIAVIEIIEAQHGTDDERLSGGQHQD